ncbi:hypothetical protein [Halorubellus salinus]|uniref:hypothetical protein n=1 Tax=Halorubellus salinus TaxID=755309 RepID=UPI001D084D55|nr:hypothetical protein [Halorubellus salinus]
MNRRAVLRRAGAAAAASGMTSVAGCGVLGSCGPGENEIGALAERAREQAEETESENASTGSETTEELPRVVGAIEKATQSEVAIDDGTGRASLQTLGGGFQLQNIETGDCAYAVGFPIEPDAETDADVTIIVTDIGLEE